MTDRIRAREAIYHKLMMWDALRDLEELLGFEIEEDILDDYAGDCNSPSDITDEIVLAFLAHAEEAANDDG